MRWTWTRRRSFSSLTACIRSHSITLNGSLTQSVDRSISWLVHPLTQDWNPLRLAHSLTRSALLAPSLLSPLPSSLLFRPPSATLLSSGAAALPSAAPQERRRVRAQGQGNSPPFRVWDLGFWGFLQRIRSAMADTDNCHMADAMPNSISSADMAHDQVEKVVKCEMSACQVGFLASCVLCHAQF